MSDGTSAAGESAITEGADATTEKVEAKTDSTVVGTVDEKAEAAKAEAAKVDEAKATAA